MYQSSFIIQDIMFSAMKEVVQAKCQFSYTRLEEDKEELLKAERKEEERKEEERKEEEKRKEEEEERKNPYASVYY